jgi:hypothetical protein
LRVAAQGKLTAAGLIHKYFISKSIDMHMRLYNSRIFLLKFYLTCFLTSIALSFPLQAQSKYCVDEIKDLELHSIPGEILTYYSEGKENRALELKTLLERASTMLGDSLNLEIKLTLAALNVKEWAQVIDKPYGLPTLRTGACKRGGGSFPEPRYVAILPGGIDGALYNGWIALEDSISTKTLQKLKEAGVGFEQGGKIMIDFVALHELGHAYHLKFGIKNYVNFFAEFMADYIAYAFLRSTEERLDKKVLAVLSANIESITPVHSSFIEWENFQSREHPPTEAWYNSVVTLKAAEIYEQRGFEFLHAIRIAFPEGEGQLKTETILARMDAIHPGILKWSNNISELVRKRK